MNYVFFLFSIAVAACSSAQESTTVTPDNPHSEMSKTSEALPAAVATPWVEATEHYLALKDALVEDDFASAKQHAQAMNTTLAGADMAGMGEYHDAWMKAVPSLVTATKQVSGAAGIEAARAAFAEMSQPMVAGVKAFGDGGEQLYVQHCPMAFDNAGADWVSAEETIRNPYFGAEMLTCGKVTEEL